MNGWPLILFLTFCLAAVVCALLGCPAGFVFAIFAGVVAYVEFVRYVAGILHKGVRP